MDVRDLSLHGCCCCCVCVVLHSSAFRQHLPHCKANGSTPQSGINLSAANKSAAFDPFSTNMFRSFPPFSTSTQGFSYLFLSFGFAPFVFFYIYILATVDIINAHSIRRRKKKAPSGNDKLCSTACLMENKLICNHLKDSQEGIWIFQNYLHLQTCFNQYNSLYRLHQAPTAQHST